MLMCRSVCTFVGSLLELRMWIDSSRLLDVYWASAMEGKTHMLEMFLYGESNYYLLAFAFLYSRFLLFLYLRA